MFNSTGGINLTLHYMSFVRCFYPKRLTFIQYCGQSPQEQFGVKCIARDTTTCWLQWDSNLLPPDLKSSTLSTELQPPFTLCFNLGLDSGILRINSGFVRFDSRLESSTLCLESGFYFSYALILHSGIVSLESGILRVHPGFFRFWLWTPLGNSQSWLGPTSSVCEREN